MVDGSVSQQSPVPHLHCFVPRLPECGSDIQRLTQLLADAFEFAELPVRHNEDELNGELAKLVPWEV